MFVPAFPAVYGGYYIGFGSIFNVADLEQTDVAAARLAANLVFGVQLGWFSLGGVRYGPDYDTSCGPMGTYDYWMRPTAAPMIAYLKLLVAYRTAVQDYLVRGRLMQPVTVSPTPSTFYALHVSNNMGYG